MSLFLKKLRNDFLLYLTNKTLTFYSFLFIEESFFDIIKEKLEHKRKKFCLKK